MIKLLRVHERLYVADAAPVDVGNGREKFLCFIASADSQAPFLDLAKVFGRDGAVAIVSVPQGASWKGDRSFINNILGAAGCVFALVRFDRSLVPRVDVKLFAVESGAKWVVTQKCLMRAEFGAVGAIIPNGAALSLLASGGEVQVDAVGAQAITLEGFGMYGAQKQETRRVFLDFLAADPGRLRFEIDLAVVSYNKDQPSLGLQYFRAVQEFSGSFGFQRLHYPLFSTPTAGGGSALQLAASLDLREPAPGHVPRAMLRSEVRVRKVVTHGLQQAAVALNKFAADGTRLFATAKSVSETLAFHFASAPTEMESATSVPRYDGLVLLPHGSVEINSASGALLGSSLLERVSEFRTLGFNLEHPADALDATMWFTDPKKNRKTSDTEGNPRAYLSRYAITSAAEYGAALSPQIKFSPDRLALYALGGRAGAYRAIQCGVPSRLPIAPLDFEASGGTTEERSRFDATVIARHRAGLLGDAAIARASSRQIFAVTQPEELSTTPQGFKVTDAGASWSEVEFARGDKWRIALAFGSDPDVAKTLQQAFLEKEIFIVARRLPAAQPGSIRNPTLDLAFIGSGWEFRTSIVGSTSPAVAAQTDTSPLVLIKFGSRAVAELVGDAENWTGKETFVGNAAEVSAVKARLNKIIKDLQTDHADELAAGNTTDTFTGPFVNTDAKAQKGKLFDANWNGVVVLSVPMSTANSPFPPDLQPILDSYKYRLQATVLCADLRPATASSGEQSQVLALIRYLNPDKPVIKNGSDPDCSGGFDLQLLKVRLRAALVEKFECRLSLGLGKFFGQQFDGSGVLVGAYDRRVEAGVQVDVYSFSLVSELKKTWGKGSFLSEATLTRLGYERAEPKAGEPRGRFLVKGSLSFDLDNVGVNGLEFDRMGIEFGAGDRSFLFSPGLLKVNVDREKLGKLLGKLPFKLTSFVFGRLSPIKLLSLGDLGFQPLPLLGGDSEGDGTFSYAFTFDLDLGSLGALSKKLEGFKGELLLGWKMVSGTPAMSLGFKLKGNKGGPLDFSLLDVIQVRAKQFGFGQLRNGEAYYVYAAGLQLRLLDQTFPSQGADQSIFVFYPSAGGSVAWLYARVDGDKDSAVPLFAIGQRVEVDNLLKSKTTLEGITALKKVFKNTLEPDKLPYDGTSDVKYHPKADWLLGLEAKVFDVATLQVLVAEPSLYGARVTISKDTFKFLAKDWFFDLLYRRLDEDTGIFSMEVPPPIDMLDFGAVQVILPTIRGEVGTPGSHLLVDLGYPGKKSIAAWQRTGKIVAGIFGGDGGGYLGRVAPRTFPVQLKPEYAKYYEFKKDSCFMVGMAGSFGLMRYFSSGPMSGHASLTGFFMLEGALATLRSRGAVTSPALEKPPSTYLMLEGQFGVKGCIEACADFKLIKAYVGVEFKAYFGFDYETWKGIVFSAGIVLSAYARLVIARIRIPFDGSFELALEFRFSFEARFELRLSDDDPRWKQVFESNAIVLPSAPLLPRFPAPAQVRVPGKLKANWTWPSPTPSTLGLTKKVQIEYWLVAVPTLADSTSASGRRLPAVVGHLLAGEHPVYTNRPNSILALADAMLRWMLPQIMGMAKWDGNTLIAPHDPLLLDAHQALQPEGKDSRLTPVDIPADLTGLDPNQTKKGVRLISREANIAKPRPGFKGLTAARLLELYCLCFDTQVALPKDGGDKEKDAPACVPFPLPPLFELLYVVQKPSSAGWTDVSKKKRDLAVHRLLSETEVDELQHQLDEFHALLKAERDIAAAKDKSVPRPMQEWVFLSWHQLFCTELLRQAIDKLEQIGPTTFEGLRVQMVADPKGPAYIAAQGVSRLFAGGLRFKHEKKTQGSFALAGTLFEAPELGPNERSLLCLKESVAASGWKLDTKHVADCGTDGLPQDTLGFVVTDLTRESVFVVPSFTPSGPKGYEDLPREFPLAACATLGGEAVHAFPKELVLALVPSEGLAIKWEARMRNGRNELEPANPQPAAPRPESMFKLRGITVATNSRSFEVGLLPLALPERELVHALAARVRSDLRIGYRPASSAPETPYTELTPDNLKQVTGFRVDVSQEERPTVIASSVQLPFYAESSKELIGLLSAWARTGSRTCRLTVPLPPGGGAVAKDVEVELILLSDADAGAGICAPVGNAIAGVLPAGATWYAVTTDLLRRVPSSPPEALLVEARRDAMRNAMARMPARLQPLCGGDEWVSVGRLRELREAMAFGTSSECAQFREDFYAQALQADAEASHFDLLALQVKVDGIEKIGFEQGLPLIPTTEKAAQNETYLNQAHVYRGFVPTKLLVPGQSPYALVGRRVEVLGRTRDHYGQQAPHDPVRVLDRVEEYRDEIVGPDAWEHISASLRSSSAGISLVLRANIRACWLENARADFVRRRLALIRHQLGDTNLRVAVQWCFGDKTSTAIDKQAFINNVLEPLEKSLTVQPSVAFVEFETLLALPKMAKDWEVEPFGAVLRMSRPAGTCALVREATAALDPEGLSIKGSSDSVDSLIRFFEPIVALFSASLAVCDPTPAHGSYFLLNPKCLSGEFVKDDNGFHSIPPFANKPVSIKKADSSIVDRDLDATLAAACEALDGLLDEKKLSSVRNAVPALLSLKRQFALTCRDRLIPVFTGARSPEAARRAVEDAVSQRATECWRLASVADLVVKPRQGATSGAFKKIVGDFKDSSALPAAGVPAKSLPVSTIGITCENTWRIPVLAWMQAEPGLVSVPALDFNAKHVLVDLAVMNALAGAAGTVWLRLVDVGGARLQFTVPAFTAPAPLRRVLETPVAAGHQGLASNPKPRTVAEAKLWHYSAAYHMPGNGLQKGTDALYVTMTSPDGRRSLALSQTPEQSLLLAADAFIASARASVSGTVDIDALRRDAIDFEANLTGYGSSRSFGPTAAPIAAARVAHDGKAWVCKNTGQLAMTADIAANGASGEFALKAIDSCLHPCATTDLYATRNEKLKAGFGANPAEREVSKPFIYATPLVGFKSEVLPTIDVPGMVTGGIASAKPSAWLGSVLQELLGKANGSQKAQLLVQCRLGFYPNNVYSLIKEDNEPAAVVMLTSAGESAATEIPLQAASAADAWLAEMGSSGTLGFWCAEVVVFRDINAQAPERFLAMRRVRGPAIAVQSVAVKSSRRVRAARSGKHQNPAVRRPQ